MVLMLMVRAIALRIIVLLLQQHFFFQNGSHVHNNFKPAHGGLSKPLADISLYLCPSWVSTKDAVLLQATLCITNMSSPTSLCIYHYLVFYCLVMFKEIRSRSYKSWIKPMSRDIQHLTDSKFEEIKTMFLKELKDLDILFLAEMFCSSKITDSFYNIPGYALF